MNDSVESEKLGISEVLTIDSAKELMKVTGDKAKELEKSILEKQDILFKDIYCVTFGWKLQKDKSRKLVSKMPNGKILFPDRSEDTQEIEPGLPYLCLVYEREKEAFAKIVCEEYQPKIYVPTTRIPRMVYREPNGKMKQKAPVGQTYEERMISAIKEMEDLGFPYVKIVFRKNQRA